LIKSAAVPCNGVFTSALGEAAEIWILAIDVGNRPDAAEQSGDFLILARFFENAVDEGADAGVLFEVGIDKLAGFALLDAQILREAEWRQAIDDSEVNHLRLATVIGGDHERRNAEDLGRGEGVNVVTAAEGFDQQRVFREVGEQAEFDLRIVGS